jgi:hypothetical protein
MSRSLRRPSPALIIAVVALFVALGGTGYAAIKLPKASVGAKQLKKNAVTSAKVKNSSLLLGDFRASERRKLRGPAGTPGAQGLQGIQGPKGATGVEKVVVRSAALLFASGSGGDGQTLSASAQCQAAETVVGGGTEAGPTVIVGGQPNTFVTASRPADASGGALGNGAEPRGWYAEARRNSQTSAQTVTIYVLCASAG